MLSDNNIIYRDVDYFFVEAEIIPMNGKETVYSH